MRLGAMFSLVFNNHLGKKRKEKKITKGMCYQIFPLSKLLVSKI